MSETARPGKHPPEALDRALAAWIRLGSSTAAERETGISAGTLRAHKHRFPERFADLKRIFDAELQEKRRAIAAEVVEGLREGTLVCRRLLRADPSEAARAAHGVASVVRALAAVDANLDRFARLDAGSPTEITEDRRSDAELVSEIERALNDPALVAAMDAQRGAR